MFNLNYLAGGRLDPPFYPTKPSPFIKGRRVTVSGPVTTDTYNVPGEMELLTMSVGCSRYNDKDHWSLKVDNKLLFDSVFTKDVPEGFYFMVTVEVVQGSKIEFTYNNDSGTYKTVWVNYQFLRD